MQATPEARPKDPTRMKPGTTLLPGLRRVRTERNLSIRELASRANVSPNTVYLLEHLKSGAEPKTRRKLADALDTGVRVLWTQDEETPRE